MTTNRRLCVECGQAVRRKWTSPWIVVSPAQPDDEIHQFCEAVCTAMATSARRQRSRTDGVTGMSYEIELHIRISSELREVLNTVTRSGKFFGRPTEELVVDTLIGELRFQRCEGEMARFVVAEMIRPLEECLGSPQIGFNPQGAAVASAVTADLGIKPLRDAMIQFGRGHVSVSCDVSQLEDALRKNLRSFLTEKVNAMLSRWDKAVERDRARRDRQRLA